MSPNPIAVAWSMLRALRVRRPVPADTSAATVDHSSLAGALATLASQGIESVDARTLLTYRDELAATDPNDLSSDVALAYWLNLYNAGALELATRAASQSASTVLRVPGAFDSTWATVAGEALSLNDIEHGKIRRFKDPRIHAALVCGSASCPTLRLTPYSGEHLQNELDDQMRAFLRDGGLVFDDGSAQLSRILLWYGADFVRPSRMPNILPVRRRQVAAALQQWTEVPLAGTPIEFQPYDWALSCSIG
ncbi:MAG: DUF547 domain-containing protein [Acidimicrobiia bacterium]|nr:DUF547 domain-containing protein [Acidimicrobiia bacterium]